MHPCVYEAVDSSGSGTVPFGTHTAGSRVESVLCQEDVRVALVETAILKRGNQLTIHEKRQAQHLVETLCGID